MINFEEKYSEMMDNSSETATTEQSVLSNTTPVEEKSESKTEGLIAASEPKVEAVAETRVEARAEEPEVTETKPVEQVKKSWFEEEDETPAKSEPIQNNSEIDELKKKLAELESRSKELETIPEIQAIVEAKKSGKEISDVLKELKGVDYDALTPEQLYEHDLKTKGFSEDEIEELKFDFLSQTTAKQKLQTLSIKDNLKYEQSLKIQNIQQRNLESQKQQDELINRNVQKAQTELDSLSAQLENKEMYGVVLTKEIINSVKDAINNEKVIGDSINGFDIQKSFEENFKSKYFNLIVKTNVQMERAKTMEKALNEVSRPDANITSRQGNETNTNESAEVRSTVKNIWSRE